MKCNLISNSAFLCVFKDMSSVYRVQVLAKEKKIEEAINLTINHEIRNPLNSLLVMLQEVQSRSSSDLLQLVRACVCSAHIINFQMIQMVELKKIL